MAAETPETPAETLETLAARIDHLDVMLHQFLGRAEPLLAKGERFLGNPVADYLKARKHARS